MGQQNSNPDQNRSGQQGTQQSGNQQSDLNQQSRGSQQDLNQEVGSKRQETERTDLKDQEKSQSDASMGQGRDSDKETSSR